jgi:type IV secretion system protein VirB10
MNDATLLEPVEATFDGALPTLDAKDAVLGAPQSKVKSKTNVGKLGILLGVLAGFMLIIGGLLIYQKNRKTTAVTPTEKAAQAKPGFSIKNDNVSSDSIDRVKAELKKKDAEQQAQVKAIEEEQANVQKILAAEAEKRKQLTATPAAAAQSAPVVNGQPQVVTPVVARPPSPAERKMFGNVLLDSSGTKPSVLTTATTTEQTATQREVAARMAALGITPANSGSPASAAPTATASAPASSNGITSVGGGSSSSGGGQGGESLASRLQPTVLAARSALSLIHI